MPRTQRARHGTAPPTSGPPPAHPPALAKPRLSPHTAQPRPQELKLAKTLWGVDESNDTSQWDALFARIKAEGFSAIEAAAPFWRKDTKLMQSLLEKHGLGLICQIHTTGGDIDAKTGEYIYCTSNKLVRCSQARTLVATFRPTHLLSLTCVARPLLCAGSTTTWPPS